MTGVSRDTFAGAATQSPRRYQSPYRSSAAEQKRAALIAAVLVLANRGNYRGTAQELADMAGVRRQSIGRYFGCVELLYRVVAREHWKQVELPLPLAVRGTPRAKDLVWLVLVGQPRDLP